MFEITHVEQAAWQRRAAGELSAILHAHRDLPVIAWTLASAGSVVMGRVSGLAPAQQIRHTFEAWRAALMLSEHRECTLAGGTTYLRAHRSHARVHIKLTATVAADPDQEMTS